MAHTTTPSTSTGLLGRWLNQLFLGPAPARPASVRPGGPARRPAGAPSGTDSALPEAPASTSQHLVREAVRQALVRIGLDATTCDVAVKPGKVVEGARCEPIHTYVALIRLNQWHPEVLLKSKAIEQHIQLACQRLDGVRITHVFWRFGSDVRTPYDPPGSVVVKPLASAAMPEPTLPAQACASPHDQAHGDTAAPHLPQHAPASTARIPTARPVTPFRSREPREEHADATPTEIPADAATHTIWGEASAFEPSPPRVWAETQPCELPLPIKEARKEEAIGFVRL